MKSLIVFLLFAAPLLLTAQENAYFPAEPGKTCALLADKVNVRSGPDKSEKVIATLPIGTEVEVLEKSEGITLRGIEADWLKVRFEQDGKQQEGYLWEGMVAAASFNSSTEPEINFFLGVSHMAETEWGEQLFLQIRAVRGGKEIARLKFETVGGLAPGAYWTAMDGRGVPGIQDIFNVGFDANYCAGPACDVYLFWDGKAFYHAKTIYSGSDAPVFQDEALIFPEDEDGRKDKIIFTHKAGEHLENGEEELEEDWEETYVWTGKKLKKISR